MIYRGPKGSTEMVFQPPTIDEQPVTVKEDSRPGHENHLSGASLLELLDEEDQA